MDTKVIFGGHFQVYGKIGSGSFGQIYECIDSITNKRLAIKLEQIKQGEHSQLRYEAQLYQVFQGANGICKVFGEGCQDGINYLVIEKLGSTLDKLMTLCKGRFSRKTVLMIADQLISRIEFLHMKGFLHRDIKPNNFMTGAYPKQDTLYIIDFGLAKRYKDFKTKQHIKPKQGKPLIGTARYASIASHEGYQQCRRDDLESIGYLFIYFLKGTLPWQGLKEKEKDQKYGRIGFIKKTTPIEKLCDGYPEFLEYMKEVRKLSFTDQPDYDYLRKILRQQFIALNYQADCFDWDQPSYEKSTTVQIKKK